MEASHGSRLRPGQDGVHTTFCRICEAFCGVLATVKEGVVLSVGPDRDNPLSRGHLCVKGANCHGITHDPDRILYPMRRTGGPGEFEPVSWDTALSDIAARWRASIARHGPRSCGTYWGNPSAFSATWYLHGNRLLREIGVTRFFNAASLDSNARSTASYISFGSTSRQPIPDLPHCDFLIVIGANPLISNGSILTTPTIRDDLDKIAERGRVVVIDPRRTETASRYEHLPIRPTGDAFLLAAMLRQVALDGLADMDFIASHTTDWSLLLAAVQPFTPDYAQARCGIPADAIVALARDFATAERGAIYSRVGIGRARFSATATFLVDALNVATGKFARPGGWVFGKSPFSVGKLPPDYTRITTRFGEAPQIYGMAPVSIMADEISEPGADQIRSFAMVAGNPVLSGPGGERLEAALADLEIFFAIDLYMNESNRHADYILPATSFLEREDIPMLGMSHMPRPYVQYSDAVVPPQGESRSEVAILSALLAHIQGESGGDDGDTVPEDPKYFQALDAMLQASDWPSVAMLKQAPQGMMMGDLDYEGWQDKITHADGKVHFWHPMLADDFTAMQAWAPSADSLLLFGRRDLRSINSWAHNVDRLVRSQSPSLLIHPDDAAARGIEDGAAVELTGPGGAITVEASLSRDVVRGSVSYPHGWGHRGGWRRANATLGVNINVIMERGLGGSDDLSGVARLEGFPVTVRSIATTAGALVIS